ncbi:MAG: hypothetical protein IGR76_17155 [Synechococcales cyanobacterium T60_A2020_003]|nr:hypothetical protein [Synechococcales cyanobacterium T60_A2020_003]
MTCSNSRSTSANPHHSIFTTQPWEAIKWFWRFSLFYGRYIPTNGVSQTF